MNRTVLSRQMQLKLITTCTYKLQFFSLIYVKCNITLHHTVLHQNYNTQKMCISMKYQWDKNIQR